MSTATATTVLVRRLNNWALPVCMALMDACWIYIVAWLLATQVLYKVIAVAPPSPVLLALLELSPFGSPLACSPELSSPRLRCS